MLDLVVVILCLLAMMGASLGSVLPIIPGLPVFFVVYLVYGLFDHWSHYGLMTMIVVGGVIVVSLGLDQLASVVGAQKMGAKKAGMIGSAVCSIIGLIFFSLPGLLIGAFAGAVAFEMIFNERELGESMKAGGGALIGFVCGGLFKFMISVILTMSFIFLVILS
ncbi:MAG: DUF456 domain-containing protein [Deltaproteobacteria bacterium]|nr:DUF456 domain-containing protein [Deltaproteobacteria bacterium]